MCKIKCFFVTLHTKKEKNVKSVKKIDIIGINLLKYFKKNDKSCN